MPDITIKDMLNAGVHFGHQTNKWNAAMKPYVYSQQGSIYIIDLEKSYQAALKASEFIKSVGRRGGRVCFVGTKKQAQDLVKQAAQKCHQFYIVKRWLGGTLTNFATIRARVDRLKKIDQMKEKGILNYYTKKEQTKILKEYNKILVFAEGIPDMNKVPDALFVVDINSEKIAVKEARKLGIPVVGIVDTNTDPREVDYPIPGNDDALKSIRLFCDFIADSYSEGYKEYESYLSEQQKDGEFNEGVDQGEGSEGFKKGPHVIRTKTRMVVAAGTAEDVEIEMELAKEDQKNDDVVSKEGEDNKKEGEDNKKEGEDNKKEGEDNKKEGEDNKKEGEDNKEERE